MFSEFEQKKTPKDRATQIIVLLAFMLIILLLALIVHIFIPSWILTCILITFLFYCLCYSAGILMMFPGYFSYYQGTVEKNYSKDSSRKLINAFNTMDQVHIYLSTGLSLCTHESLMLAQQNIKYFRDAFSKYQQEKTLSKRKEQLCQKLKQILEVYYLQTDRDSIKTFVFRNHTLNCKRKPSNETSLKLQNLSKQAMAIVQSFDPPENLGFVKNTYYLWKQQKLYEIRFGTVAYKQMFDFEEYFVNNKINLMIIKGFKDHDEESLIKNTNKLILFCNPNGAYLQLFPFETTYCRFYLEQGYNVGIWNYRGYSKSIGSPSLSHNKQDALTVYDFITNKGYNISIVHGYSIGGPTSIYLASQRKVDLLITDRTFSSLHQLAKRYGKILHFLSKIVFWKQRTDYSKIYVNLSCRKLMIYDPNDEIISNLSSLKTGVARLVMKDLEIQSNPELNMTITQTSDEFSSLYVNAKTALKKFFPQQQQLINHFPSDQFVKFMISSSLPFAYNREKRTKMRHTHSKNYFDQSVDSAIEIMQKQSTKHQLSLNQQNKIKLIDKDLLAQIGRIGYVDSAFMDIPTGQVNKFKTILKESNCFSQMRSYIEGLIVFGSHPMNKSQYQNSGDVRKQTILKIHILTQQLKSMQQSISSTHPSQSSSLLSLRLLFYKIAFVIHQTQKHQIFNKIGMILPVNCGHNGQIKQIHYKILLDIINQKTQSNCINQSTQYQNIF